MSTHEGYAALRRLRFHQFTTLASTGNSTHVQPVHALGLNFFYRWPSMTAQAARQRPEPLRLVHLTYRLDMAPFQSRCSSVVRQV